MTERLNDILTIELTVINQYFVRAKMCKNWGFERMYNRFHANSIEEMQDAQRLIGHILYLEGMPNLQRLNQIMVGESVLEDLELDLLSKQGAVETLRQAIAHCASVGDYATRNILEQMVLSEEGHIDWIETQLEAINAIGIDLYLTQQIRGD